MKCQLQCSFHLFSTSPENVLLMLSTIINEQYKEKDIGRRCDKYATENTNPVSAHFFNNLVLIRKKTLHVYVCVCIDIDTHVIHI